MAMTKQWQGLSVRPDEHYARMRVKYDAVTDLPDKGDAVADSSLPPGTWYLETIENMEPDAAIGPEADLILRQAGLYWTWTGLTPIAKRGSYELSRGQQGNGTDGYVVGYWQWFSNWPAGDNWAPDELEANTGPLRTWEIEFVAASNYESWHNKRNGTWPSGLTPPAGTSAGIYLCRYIKSESETYPTRAGGTNTVWRHWATFWEAPEIDATRMVWRHDAW